MKESLSDWIEQRKNKLVSEISGRLLKEGYRTKDGILFIHQGLKEEIVITDLLFFDLQ